MSKPGFSWVTPILCVSDLPGSLEHYEQTLGFEIAWRWSETEAFETPDHPTFACVCRGDISLFLCENGQGNPGSWICLNVRNADELDALHQEYRRSSADIAEPPSDRSWGMREMLIRDPDANVLRIGCVIED